MLIKLVIYHEIDVRFCCIIHDHQLNQHGFNCFSVCFLVCVCVFILKLILTEKYLNEVENHAFLNK